MFAAHCTAEDRQVMLTERRIVSIEMTDETSTITFRCWCGALGRASDRRWSHRPRTLAAAA